MDQTGAGVHPDNSLLSDGPIGRSAGAVADWLTSSDHKKIGRLFTGFGLLGMTLVAVIGALLQLEDIIDSDPFSGPTLRAFGQLHHFGLVLMVLAPLTVGLSLAVVPMQVGARSIAFARSAQFGFVSWFLGAVLTAVAVINGGGIGGSDSDMVDLSLASMALMSIGLCAVAVSIATTVLTSRAPGMTMRRVPFFSWSALIQSLAILITLPVLLGLVVYLFVDHRHTARVFGGSEAFGVWIPRFFSAPIVYIFAIPALGVFAEAVPVAFGRRHPLRQVVFAGLALVGIGGFSAVTMQNDFPVDFSGVGADIISELVVMAFFVGLPLLGVIVTLFASLLVAKPTGGPSPKPRLVSPLLFGLVSLLLIALGAIVGVLLQIVDLELLNSNAVTGSVVLVALAGALGAIGGLAFWSPKLSGRSGDEKKVAPLALLGGLGTLLAGAPMVLTGISGTQSSLMSTLSLVGYALIVLTVLAYVAAMRSAPRDGGLNPWCAHTIEWSLASPAPADNYSAVPVLRSAEPELDQTSEGSPS